MGEVVAIAIGYTLHRSMVVSKLSTDDGYHIEVKVISDDGVLGRSRHLYASMDATIAVVLDIDWSEMDIDYAALLQ